jgi:PHP family Zn ribbon phosphoesterase
MDTTEKNYSTQLSAAAEMIDQHVEKKSLTGVSSAISSWIEKLGEHDGLKMIADDLEKLKTAITDKDGKKIAALMTQLGTATTKAAESAEGTEASKIKHLGTALTNGAKMLTKMV